MIVGLLALIALAAVLWFAHIHISGAHAALDNALHAAEQDRNALWNAHTRTVEGLLENNAEERRAAAQERSVLLNRIQDPAAGVATSLAMLPAPPDLGVEFER